MFNFGVSFAHEQPNLNLYRFDDRGTMLYRRRLPLEYPCSLHDFGLSGRHAVFYLSPYNLDMRILANPGRTLLDALCWEPQRGSRLVVCDRQTGTERLSLPLEKGYCLHFINCYDAESDQLVVDVLELERPVYDQYQVIPDLFSTVGPGRPVRYTVDLASGTLTGRSQIDYSRAPDFAAVDPRRAQKSYRYFWMLGIGAQGQPGRKFFDQLVRGDWRSLEAPDIYQAPAGCYLGGEPVFVGDGTESAGTVICQLFDADKVLSSFVLFDAFDLSRGPRATLHLKHPVPLGFHTAFSQSTVQFPTL
jgi:all-trans-8'-apo-beta-carotenal 15,15'-oxygenase